MKFTKPTMPDRLARPVLIAQKNSPRILMVAGLAGSVVGTVLACRATLKLSAALDDFSYEVKAVRELREDVEEGRRSARSYHIDMAYVYGKNTSRIARLYAPAAILGATSLTAIASSHAIMTRRNTSLTAAYSALQLGFSSYRERVRAQLNEDVESDIYHDVQTTELIDENGKKHKVKTVPSVPCSPYARFFDEYSSNWTKNAELNKVFIQCQQNWANQRLQSRGHLFLNEVYDDLGLSRTQAGQIVGWTTVPGSGDGYVDFGLLEERNVRFAEGWERSVLLDFNVDGNVLDLIGEK
jgi:hypothetical protein